MSPSIPAGMEYNDLCVCKPPHTRRSCTFRPHLAYSSAHNARCDHVVLLATCKHGGDACGKDQLLFLWERANVAPLQSRNNETNHYQILWMMNVGKMKRSVTFDWGRFCGALGWNIQFPVSRFLFSSYFSSFRWSGYIEQFATDFDEYWLKRRGLAQ